MASRKKPIRNTRFNQLLTERFSGVQVAMANCLGITPSLISRYASGSKGIGEDMKELIEGKLNLSQGWLDGIESEKFDSNVELASPGTRRIPVISYVQAGNMTEAIDPYAVGGCDKWLLTDLELSSKAFALVIRGDSMLPEFRNGDNVIIDPAVQPQPGDYVVAKNHENEATFKKYRPRGINVRGEQVFELVPLNEDYPSMRSDLVNITIIGTMVEHRRYRKR